MLVKMMGFFECFCKWNWVNQELLVEDIDKFLGKHETFSLINFFSRSHKFRHKSCQTSLLHPPKSKRNPKSVQTHLLSFQDPEFLDKNRFR